MEQAGSVDDQLIRCFGCQLRGSAGDRFGAFQVQCGNGPAPQLTNPGTARILTELFAKSCAEGPLAPITSAR
jgi:hypothetical protein